jgi:ATP-dependent exoDNAse (exonuclease V) beta subunit
VKTFKHDFVTLPKIEKVELAGKRYYVTPSGNNYQSVTTLTGNWNKKAITEWRNRVGEEKANKISSSAAKRGTSLHKTVEHYLLNKPIHLEENVLNKSMFYKIQPLVDRLDNIKVVEGTLYSDELKLAGTTDCIAEYSGDLSVIDFKTSSRMKNKSQIKNYFMQGAAYGKMYEELFGVKPKKVVIMMAVESAPFPQCMIEPFDVCLDMLKEFMAQEI